MAFSNQAQESLPLLVELLQRFKLKNVEKTLKDKNKKINIESFKAEDHNLHKSVTWVLV